MSKENNQELMPSDVGGAPTKFTPLVVNKLVAAFNNDFNITEACHYAGISRETYYTWLENIEGFSDKMEYAKTAPTRKAKEVVMNAINEGEDANLAFRYLQARDPDYKQKGELEVSPNKQLTEQKIEEFLDDTNDIPDDSSTDTTSGSEEVAQSDQHIS